ncbi:MAG: cbb3-type cytochrome oxidase assembly protein CcoS [Pseudomonadales bacterium]|nr:cbb3-type cytochrome oxidase assembly protein CcoS [Pseudomonadales bacterium]
MQSLYILLPIALFFCFAGLGLFVWSMNSKQFDDLEREAQRILEIDTPPRD